jgi:hypothetical protein
MTICLPGGSTPGRRRSVERTSRTHIKILGRGDDRGYEMGGRDGDLPGRGRRIGSAVRDNAVRDNGHLRFEIWGRGSRYRFEIRRRSRYRGRAVAKRKSRANGPLPFFSCAQCLVVSLAVMRRLVDLLKAAADEASSVAS